MAKITSWNIPEEVMLSLNLAPNGPGRIDSHERLFVGIKGIYRSQVRKVTRFQHIFEDTPDGHYMIVGETAYVFYYGSYPTEEEANLVLTTLEMLRG